jgi:hypothetical protein
MLPKARSKKHHISENSPTVRKPLKQSKKRAANMNICPKVMSKRTGYEFDIYLKQLLYHPYRILLYPLDPAQTIKRKPLTPSLRRFSHLHERKLPKGDELKSKASPIIYQQKLSATSIKLSYELTAYRLDESIQKLQQHLSFEAVADKPQFMLRQ